MTINSVWVFAQASAGVATTGTLELLTKARSLSSKVTAFVGGDASAIAASLGEYGATKVYATGDLAGKLPGVALSAAMKSIIDSGDTPDVIMFPQNYEGRDTMARLSVKLNRTVLTNNIDIADSADGVVATTPIFGGNILVATAFSGQGPHLASFRPKSFAAENRRRCKNTISRVGDIDVVGQNCAIKFHRKTRHRVTTFVVLWKHNYVGCVTRVDN